MLNSFFAEDGAEMLPIPGGSFRIGISDEALERLAGSRERARKFRSGYGELQPQAVKLPDFYIDKYPVTNEQYRRFLKSSGYRKIPRVLDSSIWGSDRQPVVAIDWKDARAYAAWCRKRLPSEEEWEKAARGTDGWLFPWGDEIKENRCNCVEAGLECTSVVGSYPKGASSFGVHDMAGNVWEITTGKWDEASFTMKGGCFLTYVRFCRSSARWSPSEEDLEKGAKWLGFRCVRDAK